MKVAFSIGAAFLRGPRMFARRPGRFAILLLADFLVYTALMVIPLVMLWPYMLDPATMFKLEEGEIFPSGVVDLYVRIWLWTGPASLVFWIVSDAAWFRLLTGREAGWFPYRLGRDELRVAGTVLVIWLVGLLANVPLIALLGLLVILDPNNIWAALPLMSVSLVIYFFVSTRVAPMVPHTIVTRTWKPFTVLTRSRHIWGRLMGAFALLIGALMAFSLLYSLVMIAVMVPVMIAGAGTMVADDPMAGMLSPAFVIMQALNVIFNLVGSLAFIAFARGISAEAAICLDQHQKAQMPVTPPPSGKTVPAAG